MSRKRYFDKGVAGAGWLLSLLALANCRELWANSCIKSTAIFPAPK